MPASPAGHASEDEKTVFEMLIMSVCCLSSIVCDCLFMIAQRRSDCDSITPAPVPVLSFVHVLVAVIASLSSSLSDMVYIVCLARGYTASTETTKNHNDYENYPEYGNYENYGRGLVGCEGGIARSRVYAHGV